MATVVRLKRRRVDDPIESICIDLKKSKPNEDNSRILRLAATVDSKEEFSLEKTLSLLEESRKKQLSVSSTPQTPTSLSRKRQLQIASSDSITTPIKKPNMSSSANDTSSVKIYDLESKPIDPLWSTVSAPEDTILCNGEPLVSEKSIQSVAAASEPPAEDYVYDIFFIDPVAGEGFSHHWLEEALLYEAFEEGYGEFGNEYREQNYDISDDSNAEDNWRNDYPDEESSDEEDDPFDGCSKGRIRSKEENTITSLFEGQFKIASDEDLSTEDSDLSDFEDAGDPSFEKYYKSYKKQYGFKHKNPSGDLVDEPDGDDDNDS